MGGGGGGDLRSSKGVHGGGGGGDLRSSKGVHGGGGGEAVELLLWIGFKVNVLMSKRGGIWT